MANDAGLGGRLGVEPRGDHLALRPATGLWSGGELGVAVLLWLADWEACRAAVAGDGTQLVATRDLRVRSLVPITAGEDTVLARARIVRRSARATVIEVDVSVEGDDRLRAIATGSYVARAWDGDPLANPQITMTDPEVLAGRAPIDVPLAVVLGAQPVEGEAGKIRLPADPELQNPQGGLSGPVVALAAAAAVDDAVGLGSHTRLQDLSVTYLAAGRRGPFHASAEHLGNGTYRTEVHDDGAAVLLATGLAVTGPAPG